MAKLTLDDIANLQSEGTAVTTINNNSAAIEAAVENTLSRDGTIPNQMGADIDFNGWRALNLPVPNADTEPLRKMDLDSISGVVTINLNNTLQTVSTAPDGNDLVAVDGISTTGLVTRTATNTWTTRTLTAPAAGVSVSNGDGVSGNPTLALANDLSALEGLSSTGLATRIGTDTWAQRTITGTAEQVTVTNGSGVSGNPTISLASAPAFRVHKNGTDQTGVADSTFTAVTWSTESLDIGSHFTSNGWTPPAGQVFLYAQATVTGTFSEGNTIALAIYKDGVNIGQGTEGASTLAGFPQVSIVDTANGSNVYTVQVYADTTGGTATVLGAVTGTWFCGHWISP